MLKPALCPHAIYLRRFRSIAQLPHPLKWFRSGPSHKLVLGQPFSKTRLLSAAVSLRFPTSIRCPGVRTSNVPTYIVCDITAPGDRALLCSFSGRSHLGYFHPPCMFIAASRSASPADAWPSVAICRAVPTALKKRPICGMFGIIWPRSTATFN